MRITLHLTRFLCLLFVISCSPEQKLLGTLQNGAEVSFVEGENHQWGIQVTQQGTVTYHQATPVQLHFFSEGTSGTQAVGYTSVSTAKNQRVGTAELIHGNTKFKVQDTWSMNGSELQLKREVQLDGTSQGGFMSSITLEGMEGFTREKADFFAPGMLYGEPSNLTRTAIGGVETKNTIHIREDRLPAPLFGARFKDGSSVTVFNPYPKGNTTQQDSEDYKAVPLVDSQFQFGALGVDWDGDATFEIGFWYPGSEGETTYAGNTYPGGQMKKNRMRYHPLKDGFKQQYQVIFRFTKDSKDFPSFYSQTWRWAWEKLNPEVRVHDIAQVKRLLLDMLGERAIAKDGRTGFPQSIKGAEYEPYHYEKKATLGFVGKNLEASYFLLRDAQERENTETGRKHRQLAHDIINTFTKLPVAPPVSEGYDIDNGNPRYFGEGKNFSTVFLRSYGDDMKSLVKAIKFERAHGREHPEWLAWAKSFGDWLMTQQNANGGFPRAWDGKTGAVKDASTKTSYNPIPMFLLLAELTGDQKYKNVAVKAGEFTWQDGQNRGHFVGATIDNPDVVDKEAGTLSSEAYLALYDATKDNKWIARATAAANFAETWIYLWEVPIPDENQDSTIGLKKGMTTVGNQLISTGHSLTDNYMAFDVDEYLQLYRLTQDPHYLDVAKILLHNTKSWISTPEHPYDMKGYGWQQEHWSLAPHRGHGMHRRWLPWVTTSHLNGIFGLQDIGEDINLNLKK
ncbi:MAG: hypothetical protein ACO1OQ_15550 [Rufibacter sp.]